MMERSTLTYKLKHAMINPSRILPFCARYVRTRRAMVKSTDFLDYYRKVVDSDAVRVNPDLAIGSDSPQSWAEVGKKQFDYLIEHGLRPTDRFLDVGCGNLRLGVHLIDYLETANYCGLDISTEIVSAALGKIAENRLQEKLPYIFLVKATNYSFLPVAHFDYVHAHSVFSHLTLEEIEKILKQVYRVMKPGASFDFTYFAAKSAGSNFLNVDFYYTREQMLEMAHSYGFDAQYMDDWHYPQEKIRATVPT